MNTPFPPHFLILEQKGPRPHYAVSSKGILTDGTGRTLEEVPRIALFGFRNKRIGALPTTPPMG